MAHSRVDAQSTFNRALRYYKYTDNVLLENTLSNNLTPQLRKPVIPRVEYPGAFEKFKQKASTEIAADSSVDANIALRTLYTGQQLRRMYDGMNNTVKLDRKRFFQTELKDNENRIWWEEQTNFDSLSPMYNYNNKRKINKPNATIYGML